MNKPFAFGSGAKYVSPFLTNLVSTFSNLTEDQAVYTMYKMLLTSALKDPATGGVLNGNL